MAEIREARTDEGLILAAVQERASVAALGHIFPAELYPYPREAVHARWAAALAERDTRTLIAVSDDEPVGAALVSKEWLEGLYVIPELNVILGRWWRPLSGADSGGGG